MSGVLVSLEIIHVHLHCCLRGLELPGDLPPPPPPLLSVLQGTDRAVPVLIIGILVFLPGFYHLRIAYFASKGYRGYSYDDIPDFDD